MSVTFVTKEKSGPTMEKSEQALKIPSWLVGILVSICGSLFGLTYFTGQAVQSLTFISETVKEQKITNQRYDDKLGNHESRINVLEAVDRERLTRAALPAPTIMVGRPRR